MKKEYSKPHMFIESFVLSEHIADNCKAAVGVTTHWSGSEAGCYYTVFMEEEEGMVKANLFANANWCDPNYIRYCGSDGSVYIDAYDYNGAIITDFFSS